MARPPSDVAESGVPADGPRLAEVREKFLNAEPVASGLVRDTILASWWRSRSWKVAADRIAKTYVADFEADSQLTRSAMPVLRQLVDHLQDQPISVILTDAEGVVLTRLTPDNELDRRLEAVQLAPGFCYAERLVGTNGIGTALEGGRPMHVFGHEHYAENLERLACAAVPVQHPVTGKTVGAVNLTCWRKDAGQLLVALAKTTADQIRQAMLMDGGEREYELLRAYLRACRHTTGIVLAMSGETVMMNDHAQLALEPRDQAALLQEAGDSLFTGRSAALSVELPSGSAARVQCSAVGSSGFVAKVRLVEAAREHRSARALPRPRLTMPLPGLVGSGPLWLRAVHQVDDALSAGEWLLVDGENGVGKVALTRAVYQRRSPTGRCHVLDAGDAAQPGWTARLAGELAERSGLLVLRRVDRLAEPGLAQVVELLAERREGSRLQVVATAERAAAQDGLAPLLVRFPRTVQVPALRMHVEDLHQLVPFLLGRLHASRTSCSPAAMQLLLRHTWPGNVSQLFEVLRGVVQHRRSGVIEPEDLPAQCRTVSRRTLTPIEAMERDAIVAGLLDTGGSKAAAAAALGVSRATIYRKIHEYGIVLPQG